jgi:ribosomal protein S12 methylthiotransferase accessory factor YcaO
MHTAVAAVRRVAWLLVGVAAAPDLHAAAQAALSEMIAREDIPFIAVPDPYSETSDGWHANEAGRLRVTGALLDALSEQSGS